MQPLDEPEYFESPYTSSKREMIDLLSGLGRDKPTAEEIQLVEEGTQFDCFVFPVTFMHKLIAAREFEWEPREVVKLQEYYPFTDLVHLEPLMWEEMAMEQLILYHPHDKSFWAFDPSIELRRKDRLIKLGYKWTEVVWDWPYYYFHCLKNYGIKERRGQNAQ
jgi:hypothetical protein